MKVSMVGAIFKLSAVRERDTALFSDESFETVVQYLMIHLLYAFSVSTVFDSL